MMSIIDLLTNYIISIFDESRAAYTDNESHFINEEVEKLLRTREIIHYIASIFHFSSVELLKRNV